MRRYRETAAKSISRGWRAPIGTGNDSVVVCAPVRQCSVAAICTTTTAGGITRILGGLDGRPIN